MRNRSHFVLTIAGLDPCGGAGILADAKTFEQWDVQGLAACTAITLQTEEAFAGVSWVPVHQVELQVEILLKKYPVQFVKIGLVQHVEALFQILELLRHKFPQVKVIWDPILRTTSGFTVHSGFTRHKLIEVLSELFLVTPNAEEALALYHSQDALGAAHELSRYCSVYLKSYIPEAGSHNDVLVRDGLETWYPADSSELPSKHGSGCVLSASLTACLAKGMNLVDACRSAKEYTASFLRSSGGLLGIHQDINQRAHG